jgi:hypothetical protein
MSVAVDQPREHRRLREIDYSRLRWNCEVLSHRFKFVRPNNDDLIGQDGPASGSISLPALMTVTCAAIAMHARKQTKTEHKDRFNSTSA